MSDLRRSQSSFPHEGRKTLSFSGKKSPRGREQLKKLFRGQGCATDDSPENCRVEFFSRRVQKPSCLRSFRVSGIKLENILILVGVLNASIAASVWPPWACCSGFHAAKSRRKQNLEPFRFKLDCCDYEGSSSASFFLRNCSRNESEKRLHIRLVLSLPSDGSAVLFFSESFLLRFSPPQGIRSRSGRENSQFALNGAYSIEREVLEC